MNHGVSKPSRRLKKTPSTLCKSSQQQQKTKLRQPTSQQSFAPFTSKIISSPPITELSINSSNLYNITPKSKSTIKKTIFPFTTSSQSHSTLISTYLPVSLPNPAHHQSISFKYSKQHLINVIKPRKFSSKPTIDLYKFEQMVQSEAQNPDSFFDIDPNDNPEDDGPMTEPEDPIMYGLEFDRENVKPEYFDPEEQPLEFLTATFLQSEVEGVHIFPIYLRSLVFNKIIKTITRVQNNLPASQELDAEMITGVMFDVFTSFAPELCRTHEHALNILFPVAPRLGDVVQIPNIIGRCIVAKREYMDNRDDFADGPPDVETEIGRFMIITYQCLHPTLKHKQYVSRHIFDMDVFRLSVSQDDEGLERLMHERGMIDMYSGRIANVETIKGKIENMPTNATPLIIASRADANQMALRTDSQSAAFNAKILSENAKLGTTSSNPHKQLQMRPPVPQITLENQHQPLQIPDLSTPVPKQPQITSNQQLQSNSEIKSNSELQYQPNYTPTIHTPQIPNESKEYYQQYVVSGNHAAVLYKKLLANLADGDRPFSQYEQRPQAQSSKPNIVAPKNRPLEATLMDIHNHGALNSKMSSSGAQYGPDAFATPAFMNTTQAAIPNKVVSLNEETKLRRELDAGLNATIGSASAQSKAFNQYQQTKIDRLEEFERLRQEELEQPTQLFSEVHQKQMTHQSEMQALQARFFHLVDFYVKCGKTNEEAQALADTQFDPETGSLYDDEESIHLALSGDFNLQELKDGQQEKQQNSIVPDLSSIGDKARGQYEALPMKYKTKYKHILVKDGPGAGLPNPMLIERGEDLFEIYPNANVALMDFLSDQWSLMVKEKEEQHQHEQTLKLLREDEDHQLKMEKIRQDPELGPRQAFLDEAEKNSGEKTTLSTDVEGTRFRLLAAVAAAGTEAFTADYVTELFERVVGNKASQNLFADHIPLQQLIHEPDFHFDRLPIYNEEQQNGEQSDEIFGQDAAPIEFTSPKATLTPQLTPEGYVKVGGALLTQMEYAEQIFGSKPIPLEDSKVVPPKLRTMIRSHYKHRDNLTKEKSMKNFQQAVNSGGSQRRFSTTIHSTPFSYHHFNLSEFNTFMPRL